METQHKLKILIIDDDEFLITMYAKKFESDGRFEVATAKAPQEALDKFRNKEHYDIVLSDIALPHQSGLEILKLVREENLVPGATYIMLSNQSNDGEKDTAAALKADGFIVKANTIPSKVLDQVWTIHQNKKGGGKA